MSGGSLCDYKQYNISYIADELEEIIRNNKKEKPKECLESWEVDEHGNAKEWAKYYYNYSDETIEMFKKGLENIKRAYIYTQRIDWLVSGDDGEDDFSRRLKEDLEKENLSLDNNNLISDYNGLIQESKIYPENRPIEYPSLGLAGEIGEVAEKVLGLCATGGKVDETVKKTMRDNSGIFSKEKREAILKELGDVLWYITATAQDIGYTIEDVITNNFNKIQKRINTNTQHGQGDNREL